MRTNVTVDTTRSVRCHQMPIIGAGRPPYVTRGDWVEWKTGGLRCMGRVIGIVVDPDDKEIYIVVAMQMLGGCICERWAKPEWVYNTAYGGASHHNVMMAKRKWLAGDEFLETPPDIARDAFNLTVEEMKEMSHANQDAS